MAIFIPVAKEKGFDPDISDVFSDNVKKHYFFAENIAFWFQQVIVLESMSLIVILYKII